jgi:beta-1,4-mannosyl-glycoprotein beta-1,4-N-acetylglucosaminyltransferase
MKVKIYDCTTFFQSNLLFELRFHTLKNIVDHFVVCEATKTHMGQPKKINFDYKKWEKYGDKIIFIKVKDLPNIEIKGKKDYQLLRIQMEKLFLGIKKASSEDLIIFSDEDEIPNPNKIKDFNSNNYKYGIFMQNMYNYKINLLNMTEGNGNWPGSRICKKKNLKSFFSLRLLKIKNISEPFWKFYKEKNIQLINNGGWHFTYLMSPSSISNKIKNSAHSELNKLEYYSIHKIKKKINNLEDIFNRNIFFKKVKVDNSYPKYILDNKKKFKNWTVK